MRRKLSSHTLFVEMSSSTAIMEHNMEAPQKTRSGIAI
jgi:hypothetical protein